MLKLIFQILFYALMLLFAAYSIIMIYVLIRYGRSKILGLTLSTLYLIIILSLYTAAAINFNKLPLPQF